MPDPLTTYEEEEEVHKHWILSVIEGTGDFLIGVFAVLLTFYLIGLL